MKAITVALLGLLIWPAVSRAGFDPMATYPFNIPLNALPNYADLSGGTGPDFLILQFTATDLTTGNSDTFAEEFSVPVESDYTVGIQSDPGDDPVFISDAFVQLSPIDIAPADFNGDNKIDLAGADFNGAALPPGTSISTDVSVPEPVSLGLLSLGGLVLLPRRRRV